MTTETVSVEEKQEPIVQEQAVQEPIAQEISNDVEEQVEAVQQVPLSALQKERKRRQEAEEEARYYRDQQQKREVEPDDSEYETATKKDLKDHVGRKEAEIIRKIEEKTWIKNNPEKAEIINQRLEEFLKTRPNLAVAIEAASNRYEEAWDLLDKLTPKQKSVIKEKAASRDAPGSPSAVPKAAGINQVIDFTNMTDAEFNSWRRAQIKRR